MSISVIVPVRNGRQTLQTVLAAIRKSAAGPYELIVVDDGSTDGSVQVASKFADRVIRLDDSRGPGFARNQGAKAGRGDILFFVDADVEVGAQTVSAVAAAFEKDPDVAAVFGSYDDAPLHKDFFSQYKNLFHHFIHQKAKEYARTFWAGCGAVRREAFFKAGGFAENFVTSSIEDVVLGYRLAELGYNVRLLKDLQVRHLKKWTFLSLLRTDIVHRAIPWTRLAAAKGLPRDLNFRISDRVSAAAVWGLLLGLFASFFTLASRIFCVVSAVILLWLNRDLYGFFIRKKGIFFTVPAIFFHWFYFLYSSFIFILFSLFTKNAQELWRASMLDIYDDLLKRWLPPKEKARGLKTDLYDEAVSDFNPMTRLLAKRGSMTGVDIDYEVAHRAGSRMSASGNDRTGKIMVSDVRHLALKTDSFDFIFSNSTLDHFDAKKHIKAALRELVRVLKPEGTLIVTLDNPNNPVVFLRNILPYRLLRSMGFIPYYMGRTMYRRELANALSSYGLKISQSSYIAHAPRMPVVWLGWFLARSRNQRLKRFFEKAIEKFEKLRRWPSAPLTGYFVAVKAIK